MASSASTGSDFGPLLRAGWSTPAWSLASATFALGHSLAKNAALVDATWSCLLVTSLAAIACIDIRSRVIPNSIIYPVVVLMLLSSPARPGVSLAEALIGGLCGFVAGVTIRALTRGGIGGGDVKLALLVGTAVGYHSLPEAGVVAVLAGGVAVTAGLLMGRVKLSESVPYGPYLAIGGIVSALG